MSLENKRYENIKGYEHPENFNSNYGGNSVYKSFNEKKNKYSNTDIFNQYVVKDNLNENCPVCEENVIKSCNCVFEDNMCKNNHIWYTTRDGEVKIGNPHKK